MAQDTARKVVGLVTGRGIEAGTQSNPLGVDDLSTRDILLEMLKEMRAMRRGIAIIANTILDPEGEL